MRSVIISFICILTAALLSSCYKEEVIYDLQPDNSLELSTILRFNGKDCVFDSGRNLLRYPVNADSIVHFEPFTEFQDYSEIYFANRQLSRNTINNIGTVHINQEYPIIVKTGDFTKEITLVFTNLPIVQITTISGFFDEPKTLARLTIHYPEPERPSYSSYIGIEYRGVTAQLFPKKSYGFAILGSMNIKDRRSCQLFSMRLLENWILDAMYIDKGRLRNKVSFEIWRNMGENTQHDGLQSELVELVINNSHQGLYCLNENITAELLQFSQPDAVLYKAYDWANGAVTFDIPPEMPSTIQYWDGWEQKFPDPELKTNWMPLYKLRDFVVNSSDAEFCDSIADLIDMDNFIDYFLFLNLVTALDNVGKNTFLAQTGNTDKFFIIPWDIDASWGLFWDGTYIGYTNRLTNNLYNRLINLNPDNFRERLKTRWVSLRNSNFTETEILSLFERDFEKISKSDIISLENSIWSLNLNIEEERNFIQTWIPARLNYLDAYISGL
ncbi:MAG: CotH kinase family protein [Bacteroidales bacterium]|nr:CotH kinase family protein [Bacteroidales bacterium]HOY38085.1 CotH kinase family protein [Bacteroidales bacterium]